MTPGVGFGSAQWRRAHPFAIDAALAGFLATLSATTLWLRLDYLSVEFREPDVLGVVLTLMSTLPLAWRRRRAMLSLTLVTAATVALSALHYVQAVSGVGVAIGVYTVASCNRRRYGLAALGLALLAYLVIVNVDQFPTSAVDLVATAAIMFGAWAFGRSSRLRRAYTAELEAQARTLERGREAELRAVLAEERGRIARELHDVVAHHVSVMTVQSAAAQRTIERDPARAREAMATVEQLGRATLTEMRRIVGVLRADGEDGQLTPQPRLADLQGLVDHVREAGLDVVTSVQGQHRELSPGVDLTVFRIVQEALTNVLKHGGRTRAEVVLHYEPAAVEVTIGDTGRGLSAGLENAPARQGHGLLGMRERIAMYGGELYTGPRTGGGFLVRARIPLDTAAAAEGSAPAPPALPAPPPSPAPPAPASPAPAALTPSGRRAT